MWSATVGRRLSSCFLSSVRPVSHSCPRFPSISGSSAAENAAPAFLQESQLHSAAGSSQSGHSSTPSPIGGVCSGAVYSATSPAEGAAVLGSLGAPASFSVAQRVRDASEIMRHYGRCYWELSKARLSMLVVATSGAGYVLGSGSSVDFAGLCCTCAGTMMVAASANTLNQVFEVRNDAQMKRTRLRPLPSGRISLPHAATWAASVGIAGTSLLALKANYLASGLAASNLILYSFVYTPLKQIHPVNTWVGAIVGAIPPLLGWAAASGEMSLNSMILPAALYNWQIPHFMALAYLCRSDYIAGGFRMFSFADVSGLKTALVSFRNCMYMLPLGFLAYDWGLTSKWFALESSLLTLSLGMAALLFVRSRTTENARRMFRASLFYLPVFMSGLLLHRLPNQQDELVMHDSIKLDGMLLSDDRMHQVEHTGTRYRDNRQEKNRNRLQARPPVAYASAAPFPFLPPPLYLNTDS